MAENSPSLSTVTIGETAGVVWRVLSENGPMTMAKLVKAVGSPRDLAMLAIGWLAREGKLVIADNGRTRQVSLQKTP